MAQIDLNKERQRLMSLYAGMENEEIEEIASQADSLTEVARDALRSEMLRRGMPAFPEKIKPTAEVRKPSVAKPAGRMPSVPEETEPTDVARNPNGPKPVIIRRFLYLQEATLAKSLLDSAGIESFLADDNIVRLDWFYSNMVGGIKLLVRDEDAETAE